MDQRDQSPPYMFIWMRERKILIPYFSSPVIWPPPSLSTKMDQGESRRDKGEGWGGVSFIDFH